MRRRAFMTLTASAALLPFGGRAQQAAMPVLGVLGAPSAPTYVRYVDAVKQGLREAGYTEGQNLTIYYRWADGQYDRLPAMASKLVERGVHAILAIGGVPA